MKKSITFLLLFITVQFSTANAQSAINLYPEGGVPGAKVPKVLADTFKTLWNGKDIKMVVKRTLMPSIEVFSPQKGNNKRIGVIICSGGAYIVRANPVEGYPAAKRMAESGITAFVLNYRMPSADIMVNKENGPVSDAQRAIQYIKEHASVWHIDSARIGIMGFSAGGHLASTVGTHFNKSYIDNLQKINLRPAFMVLVYPVISFADSITHKTSRYKLIGPDITPENIREFSNELQVTDRTPPVFITHAVDDTTVVVNNSLLFIAALQKKHVPVESFFYASGGHGYGIENKTSDVQWIDACIAWINKIVGREK